MSLSMTAPQRINHTPRDWALMIVFGIIGVIYVIRKYGQMSGLHVALIFVHAFAVIIVVNLALAFNAVSTFPGLEVRNSYVASQSFDDDRAAQEALGWHVTARVEDGFLIVAILNEQGTAIRADQISATFGRATSIRDDQNPDFQFENGYYVAPVVSSGGNWNLRLEAIAENGTIFRQRIAVLVAE